MILAIGMIAGQRGASAQTLYIVKGGPDTGKFSGGVFIGLNAKINYGANQQNVLLDAKPGLLEASWKDITGLTQTGSILTKTASDGWGNAGTASSSTLDTLQNGWIQYKVDNLSNTLAFGLSASNTDAHYNGINYAVMINAGQLSIYNNGQLKGSFGVVTVNDSIRIARIGNILFYTKNKVVFFNQAVNAKLPLITDVALYTQGMAVEIKSSFAKPCDVNLNVIATPTAQTLCSGDTTAITLISAIAGATFSWTVAQSGTNGAAASSGNTIAQALAVTGLNAGTAIYAITPAVNGCVGTSLDVTITVNPLPSINVNSETIVSGQAVTLTATGATSYLWSTGETTNSITVTPTTTTSYTVNGTVNGCSNFAISAVQVLDSLSDKDKITPDGLFDNVFDKDGRKYSLKSLLIPNVDPDVNPQSIFIPCSSGYFNLYYEVGSGMDGSSPVEVARRNVLCQVLNDISSFIPTPAGSPLATGAIHINLWVKNINNLISNANTSDVLGAASSFYTMPSILNAPIPSGIADNEMYKTIISGYDSYTNVTSPLIVNNAPPGVGIFYHGMVTFNFSNLSINWETDLTVSSTANQDLYTVALHEITHALGITSFINYNGNSRLGTLFPYYTRYDKFLTNSSGTHLISSNSTGCSSSSLYNYGFNLNTSILAPGCSLSPPVNSGTLNNTVCANALYYSGTNTIPLYTPICYEDGKSLSHLEDQCYPTGTPYGNDTYFTMSNAQNIGVFKRFLQPEERSILCDLGYKVNNTYGSSSVFNSFINYSTSVCPGTDVVGLNDGLSGSAFLYLTSVGGTSITITNVLNNDVDLGSGGQLPASFECLEVIYGGGSVTPSAGTTFTYTPSPTPGIILLRYIPVSHSGKRGNITYVFIYNQSAYNCTADACNMVPNGNFEQYTSLPNYYGQINTTCGWGDANSGTADYFHALATNTSAQVPCNFVGAENDNQINGHAYAGIGLYEVIYTKLTSPLAPNTSYQLTLDASLADAYSSHTYPLTVYFAQNYVYGTLTNNSSTLLLPSSGPTYISNFNGWTPVTINFTTGSTPGIDCGQDYILIGSLPIFTTSIGTQNPGPTGSLGCSYTMVPPTTPITYTYIDNVVLKPASTVAFTPPANVCGGQTINLDNYVSINGGTFTGAGVSGNIFTASLAGAGSHTITYSYTSELGCITNVDAVINVNNLTLSTSLPTICPGDAVDISPYVTPVGGTFSGTGIASSGVFSANTVGTYPIVYSVAGCTATFNITVSGNCCAATSGITVHSGGALSNSFGTSFTGVPGTIAINGNFTINSNFSIILSTLVFAPNVKIIVTAPNTLTIDRGTFYSCSTFMWEGIEVQPGAKLILKNSKIEDAKIAVNVNNTGVTSTTVANNFLIDNTIFNRNYIGVKISNYTLGTLHPGIIRGCTFNSQSSNTSTANTATLDSPYNTQTAETGIELDNVNSIQIGDASAANYKNKFRYLRIGIKVKNSVYYVYNNDFQNNFPTPGLCVNCSVVGWAIWNTDNTACLVGGYAANQANNFQNLSNGIRHEKGWFLIVQNNTFKNITNNNSGVNSVAVSTFDFTGGFLWMVQVIDNKFKTIETGLSHRNNTNTVFYVFGNTFDDFSTRGVSAVQNLTGYINISTGGQYSLPNTFTQPTSSNYPGDVAITIFNAVAPLSASPDVTIVGNSITGSKSGIILTSINSPVVRSNTITFKNTATSGVGIRSSNGFNETISLNVITRGNPVPTSTSENMLQGVSIETNVGGAKVTENKVIRMGTGLRFRSYNTATTTVKCNIMTNNWAGLTLDAVNIGQQGQPVGGLYPQGIAGDNSWSTIPNNMTGSVSVRGKSTYTQVNFYTRTANLPWCPSNLAINPSVTIRTALNFGLPIVPLAPATCTNICYNLPCPKSLILAQIARNQSPFNSITGTARFTMQEALVRSVLADSIAPDINTPDGLDVQNFVDTTLLTTNVGKLITVSNKYSSGDIAGAIILNNSIVPTTCADEYHQTVNSVFLTTWAIGNYSFSSADSTTLYDISVQDPLECGTAIYDARVMLGLNINDYSTDNGHRMLENQVEGAITDRVGILYPNPAQNRCIYEALLAETVSGMLMMYDINGRLISSHKLNAGYNKLNIDLSQYSSGIYLYKIYINGEVVDYKKMVITK